MFTSIVCVLALWGVSPEVADAADASQPHSTAPLIFVRDENSGASAEQSIELLKPAPAGVPLGSVSLACRVRGASRMMEPQLDLHITGPGGGLLYTASAAVPQVEEGDCEVRFVWDASDLATGVYHAEFSLHQVFRGEVAWMTKTLHVLSGLEVRGALAQSRQDLRRIEAHLAGIDAGAAALSRAPLRSRCAELASASAESAYATGNWPAAMGYAAYIKDTCASIRAQLSFNRPLPRVPGSGPGPEPCFLLGYAIHDMSTPPGLDAPTLKSLGFQFLSAPVQGGIAQTGGALREVATVARENGLKLMLRFDSSASAPQQLRTQLSGPAVFPARAPSSVEWAALTVGGPAMIAPDKLRDGFATYVKRLFHDIDSVNLLWRSRLESFEEIAIPTGLEEYERWERPNYIAEPPYQYDWHSYWQMVARQHMGESIEALRSLFPGAATALMGPSHILDPTHNETVIDLDSLATLGDSLGLSSAVTMPAGPLLMDFPLRDARYALLHSLAPEQPLYDVECRLWLSDHATPGRRYATVSTALWQAVLSGVRALALRVEPGGLHPDDAPAYPEAIEAASSTQADILRVAGVVEALRSNPPSAAIVWSFPARILDGRAQYIASALNAYAACSYFGMPARFFSERDIAAGVLEGMDVVLVPDLMAISQDAFNALEHYVDQGGAVIRTGEPIPYNERGRSRHKALHRTQQTILVSGDHAAADWLHALDAAAQEIGKGHVPHAVNMHGYPLEGVVSRYCEFGGARYLYLVNLRRATVAAALPEGPIEGLDLISGSRIGFPLPLDPLTPFLIRLDGAAEAAGSPPPPPPRVVEVPVERAGQPASPN